MTMIALLLAAGAIGTAGSAADHEARVRQSRCDAAVAAIPAPPAGDVYYSPEATRPFSIALRPGVLGIEWRGERPQTSTLSTFEASRGQSALVCENARQKAAAGATLISAAQAQDLLATAGFEGKQKFVQRISLPALNATGDEALVEIVTSTNRFGGGAYLVLLRKIDGEWQVVGRKALIAS
ncbi:hypothetical protein DDF62_07255 [Caulobacter radicis]|uniref:hypothetical protein n=1 Tax=Caulobacter radicis TaxID=2172650 RepID=UPI000D56802F|nr:hypothetical protein [Caulobacter radicis]PVM91416.1 hypothetical protein DDF62_07255 [Caulobacter radicis]